MEQPALGERYARWLLLLALAGQFTLLTSQINSPEGDRSRLESVLLRVAAPMSQGSSATQGVLSGVGEHLHMRSTLLSQNQVLRQEVKNLKRELFRFSTLERDLERLRTAVHYNRTSTEPLLVADIVYSDSSSLTQTLVAYSGDSEVHVNQPVASTDGLVGRVIRQASPYVRVQLLTDGSASTGVMIDRTRRQGILRGLGRPSLQLDLVPLQEDVQVGDLIVTAGIDGVYPRGLAIGHISAIRAGSELFHDIRVEPSVDFSKLDQVYLLPPLPEADFLTQPELTQPAPSPQESDDGEQ